VAGVARTEEIPVEGVVLAADVVEPDRVVGAVLFAHGSGSSRHSSRNRFVAGELQNSGLATILADLLTPAEEGADQRTGEMRFDIGLLGRRVAALTDWIGATRSLARLPLGLFGASTGSAAALVAASERPHSIAAVVSRGGRPDLAGKALRSVHQPTLLIVGSRDKRVLEVNESAAQQIPGEVQVKVIDGATHLFEEPGTLEQVAVFAREWLMRHLRSEAHPGPASPA
jgi:putative phosphoribosyl transferase